MIEVTKDTFWAIGDNIIEITISKDQKPCVVNILMILKTQCFITCTKIDWKYMDNYGKWNISIEP
ncbi:MAG: hypothetical protein IPJ13_08195 [Saprospiraceae bacterium]|nr:hypothetical protein [Saprospiraceae bacterium]